MTPTVSIVTIFRDAERFLDEAIESVFAQTFTDWELVLFDDASSDTSPAIAARAVDRDPDRVRLLTHANGEHRGMSASRNAAIAAARAPYVAFLDGDDVFLPDKFAHQLAVFAEHPRAGLVYGPTTLWYGWTGRPEDVARDRVYPVRVPTNVELAPPTLLEAYLRERAPTPATCAVLVRRDAVVRIGGFEESFPGMYEDQVFFSKLVLHERAVVTDRSLDRYRQHDESASAHALASGEWHRHRPNPAVDRYYAWLRAYAANGAPHAPAVRRELRRAELRRAARHVRAVRAARRLRRWWRRTKEAHR